MVKMLVPRHLYDATFRSKIAFQDHEAAGRLDGRSRGRTTSCAAVSLAACASSPDAFSADSTRVPMQQSCLMKPLRHQRGAACVIQISSHEPSPRLEVCEQRDASLKRDRNHRSKGRTPASNAMASRCNTALVEPPVAATLAIAFSKASRVRICRGRRSPFSNSMTFAPAA